MAAAVKIFIFLLAAVLGPAAMAHNSNLFREYIGALFTGIKFTDVPINDGVDFHFILSFAIDYTTTGSPATPTDGQFNIFWDSSSLDPSAVADIKRQHPNVKVALSIGGATVGGNPVYFSPTSADSWVSNAVASLTGIIQQYNLDGIDIDYESFKADQDTFVDCIGRLVTALKLAGTISFASIAPYDDATVQSYYEPLWAKYGAVIDYVNFQFYAYAASTTAAQFVSYYDAQTINYAGANILASFSTSPGVGIPPETALSACRTLKAENKLFGIFIWVADASQKNNFTYDIQAQELLAPSC